MKVFLVCVLLGAFQVNAAPLTSEQKEKINSYHKNCLKQTNVHKVLIDKAREGIYTDDADFKSFLLCFSQNIGFQDANGVIQKDVFEKKVGGVIEDQAVTAKLMEQCAVQKDNPEDTAFNIAKCLKEVCPEIDFFKNLPEIVYLSNYQTQQHLAMHKECTVQLKLDEELVKNAIKQGILYKDSTYKDYILCMGKKEGILNEDGFIQKEKFYECFKNLIDNSDVVETLAQKCIVQQDTPENTAFYIAQCIYNNSPVHVDIFPRQIPISDDFAKEFIENGKDCIKETGANMELIIKIRRDAVFTDDPKLKNFTFCMLKKEGFLNETGDFCIETIQEKLTMLYKDPVVAQKLIGLCAVKQSTPQETAFTTKMCLYRNGPGDLSNKHFDHFFKTKREKRRQVIKECLEETAVPKTMVLSARKGDFQDDPLLKEYFFCLNKKCGAINDMGEFNQDFIKKGLAEMFKKEEAEKILDECFKVKDSPINTSFESFKCVYSHAPDAAKLF